MKSGAHSFGFAIVALALAVSLFAAFVPPANAQAGDPLAGLDTDIESWMRDWQVPGVAVAIVKDDQVVFSRGFGVMDVDGGEPVDEQTLFYIGSATKPFTAASIGMLIDDGLLEWDTVLADVVPEFKAYDPWVTEHLTVRDSLSHRSGLDRTDELWYAFDLDRKELVRRLRYFEPAWGFRSHFGYQNLMYVAAGRAIEEVSGTTWEDFVRQRIFEPLGMTSTVASVAELPGSAPVAKPHAIMEGEMRTIPPFEKTAVGPAGSIQSNVSDMAEWVRLNLNEGRAGDRQLISAENVREMQMPQTIIRLDDPVYGPLYRWANPQLRPRVVHGRLRKPEGRRASGIIDGFTALVSMIPSERLGLVVLTNLSLNLLPDVIRLEVYDRYLGTPDTDWKQLFRAGFDTVMQQLEEQAREVTEARVPNTQPSLPLERYAGTYQHGAYGELEVRVVDGRLQIEEGGQPAIDLQHWHYDTLLSPPVSFLL